MTAMRLLFVGNSYTARNDVPRLLASLAAAAAPPVDVQTRMIVAGGASLRRHWNAGVARQAIADGRWDWVVLQEQSTLPLKNRSRYHDNVRLFDAVVREHGSRTALYLTWSRQAAPQTQAALTEAVESIATECGATVVPVGPAWHEAMRRAPAVTLHADDGSHPTAAGSYLAACVFLVRLVGRAPQGTIVAARLGLGEAEAGALHDIATALDPA